MKKEASICDICKKVIAETKCEFCNADLCNSCRTFFGIGTEDKIMFSIISCSNCHEILQSIELEKEFKDCPNIRRELIEIFRRLIQLEELEGKVKKKKSKEEHTYPNLFGQFYPNAIYPPGKGLLYPKDIRTTKRYPNEHSFAWAASKAGKISRFKVNPDEDDKAYR